MSDRQFKPDLAGSDETLERLLERLRASRLRLPDDRGRRFTSRRPPRGGAGGAEAPVPADRPLKDLYAPM